MKVNLVNLIPKEDEDEREPLKLVFTCYICGWSGYITHGEWICPYCEKEKRDANTSS